MSVIALGQSRPRHVEERAVSPSRAATAGGGAPVAANDSTGWTPPADAGVFVWLAVGLLHVAAGDAEDDYQRGQTTAALRTMLRGKGALDWRAFGVILVARRPNGEYWVYDGGHRLKLAIQLGFTHVPCIVHEFSGSINDEAASFIDVNTRRKTTVPEDRFKAFLVADESVAVKVNSLLAEAGYRPGKSGGVRCLDSLVRLCSNYPTSFEAVFPLVLRMHSGKPLQLRLIGALHYLELWLRFMGRSLLDADLQPRLLVGDHRALLSIITQATTKSHSARKDEDKYKGLHSSDKRGADALRKHLNSLMGNRSKSRIPEVPPKWRLTPEVREAAAAESVSSD